MQQGATLTITKTKRSLPALAGTQTTEIHLHAHWLTRLKERGLEVMAWGARGPDIYLPHSGVHLEIKPQDTPGAVRSAYNQCFQPFRLERWKLYSAPFIAVLTQRCLRIYKRRVRTGFSTSDAPDAVFHQEPVALSYLSGDGSARSLRLCIQAQATMDMATPVCMNPERLPKCPLAQLPEWSPKRGRPCKTL